MPPGERFHLQAATRLGSARLGLLFAALTEEGKEGEVGKEEERGETTVAWQQEAESYQIVIKQVVKCDGADKQRRRPPAPLHKGGWSPTPCVVKSA